MHEQATHLLHLADIIESQRPEEMKAVTYIQRSFSMTHGIAWPCGTLIASGLRLTSYGKFNVQQLCGCRNGGTLAPWIDLRPFRRLRPPEQSSSIASKPRPSSVTHRLDRDHLVRRRRHRPKENP